VHADINKQGAFARLFSYAQENCRPAPRSIARAHAQGHFSPGTVFLPKRFTMRSEYRFPKSTVTLMAIILLVVIVTIEKAKAISAAAPHTNPNIGLIQPVPVTIVPPLLMAFAAVGVIAGPSWLVLFALHRCGTQRFAQLSSKARMAPVLACSGKFRGRPSSNTVACWLILARKTPPSSPSPRKQPP
jgi:hypothetical protein